MAATGFDFISLSHEQCNAPAFLEYSRRSTNVIYEYYCTIVAVWKSEGLAIARPLVRISSATTVYQRQLYGVG